MSTANPQYITQTRMNKRIIIELPSKRSMSDDDLRKSLASLGKDLRLAREKEETAPALTLQPHVVVILTK